MTQIIQTRSVMQENLLQTGDFSLASPTPTCLRVIISLRVIIIIIIKNTLREDLCLMRVSGRLVTNEKLN